jgi:prophage regulatory protein
MSEPTSILLRLPRVLEARGLRRTAHYESVARGLWTKPVAVGPRASAWPAHEVSALLAAQSAGASLDEIRTLVTQLHAARQAAFAVTKSRYLTQNAAA